MSHKLESGDPAPRQSGPLHASGNWLSSAARPEYVLLALALILLIFGIYWTIVAIVSQKVKLGIFYSEDFQAIDSNTYRVQRTGLQAGMYLIPNANLQIHVGVAGAAAQVQLDDGEEKTSYHLRGLASKVGIGYVPATGSGPTLLYEFEGTYLDGESRSRYLRDNAQAKFPKLRRSGAVMAGYTVGF